MTLNVNDQSVMSCTYLPVLTITAVVDYVAACIHDVLDRTNNKWTQGHTVSHLTIIITNAYSLSHIVWCHFECTVSGHRSVLAVSDQ